MLARTCCTNYGGAIVDLLLLGNIRLSDEGHRLRRFDLCQCFQRGAALALCLPRPSVDKPQ